MKPYYIILFLTAFIVACDSGPVANNAVLDHNTMDHSKMDHSTMASSPNAASAPSDLQFIDTMVFHHQGAVEMAQLAETRAQHEEVKTLAKNIIADQQKEIAQMKKWRADWFAGKPAAINMELAGMRDGMKGMDMTKFDSLKEMRSTSSLSGR